MAKPATKDTETPPEGVRVGEQETAVPSDAEVAAGTLAVALSEIGTDQEIMVSVYKAKDVRRGLRGGLEWCFDFRPGQLSVSDLMERAKGVHGPGEYRVYGRHEETNKFLFNRGFSINKPIDDPVRGFGLDHLPTPAPAAADGSLQAVADMFSTMMDRQETFMREMLSRRTPPTLIEQAKELAALKELFQPAPVRAPDPMKGVEQMLALVALIREAFPESGGDPIASSIPTLVKELLSAAKQPQPPRTLPAPQPGVAEMPPTPPAPTAQDDAAGALPFPNARAYFGQLCSIAAVNGDPATYANVILDNTPANAHEALLSFLERPDWIDRAAVAHPPVLEHRDWFERIGYEILGQFAPGEPGAPDLTTEIVVDEDSAEEGGPTAPEDEGSSALEPGNDADEDNASGDS